MKRLVAVIALAIAGCAPPPAEKEKQGKPPVDLGVAHRVSKGKRAVPIAVELSELPWIRRGQTVDVIVVADVGDSRKADLRGVVLFQRVQVLAVGRAGVTLELEPEAAQQLMLASSVSTVHLVVRTSGDEADVPLEKVSVSNAIGIPETVNARPRATYRELNDQLMLSPPER